eukprot:GHVH01002587.1.p1 GENE.GHVH01002587.1~~GHVH01002587.1.p1  ORF type:complete len:354 (+),score=30.19 GHVH01002587.1:1539-2600(+)
MNLCHHEIVEGETNDAKRRKAIELVVNLLEFPNFEGLNLTRLFEKQWFNCHATYQPSRYEIGTQSIPVTYFHSVFDVSSKMENSCIPNVMVSTNRTQLIAVSTRPIRAGGRLSAYYEGSSSISLVFPTCERRVITFNKWKFECACARCRSADYSSGIRCKACQGLVWPVSYVWHCSTCDTIVDNDTTEEYLTLKREVIAQLSAISDSNLSRRKMVKLIENLIRQCLELTLPGSNHLYPRLYYKLLEIEPSHTDALLFLIVYHEHLELMFSNVSPVKMDIHDLLDKIVINGIDCSELQAHFGSTKVPPTLRSAEWARNLLVHLLLPSRLNEALEERYDRCIEIWQDIFEDDDQS